MNEQRSSSSPLESLSVLLPGSVGLYIVVRALLVYWPRDLTASVIVAVMAFALLFGLIELLFRLRAASRLAHEVERLPATPSEASVDAASPVLSAMLRARLEQTPNTNPHESVAPFLTGLLVMLGLLGTLLGLFETVRGAGAALTSAGDVDALRRSLSTPIEGLTRSFGCSAAGISASAMLGLAVALVRRRESRVLRAVQRYASGPLRALAPARRQARALEQLAGQGNALPEAASALGQVSSQLGALSERLSKQHELALESQRSALGELLGGLRAELSTIAVDAGGALQRELAPLVQSTLARIDESARTQATQLGELGQALSRELERSSEQRRASEQRESERAQRVSEQLAESAASVLAGGARQERMLEQLVERLPALFQEAADAARVSAREGLEQLVRSGAERFASIEQAAGTAIAERSANEQARDRQIQEAIEKLFARDEARLGELEARVAESLAARIQNDGARERHVQDALDKLIGHSEQRLGQLEALLSEQLSQRLERERASQESAHASLQGLIAQSEQRLGKVESLLGDALSARLENERASAQKAQDAFAQLEQTAQLLDQSIAHQGEQFGGLVERVSTLLRELGERTGSEAERTLHKLGESAQQQAARLAEFSERLGDHRAEQARALSEQLTAHASELEQRLAKTSALVEEAAACWQASTVEMQTVADVFAKSVDRQREASDAWLESLGEVEGAVERAGKHAARDALTDQLASTQEVFARQLQFQRELFEQLRTLRGSQSRNGHGEHDVSV